MIKKILEKYPLYVWIWYLVCVIIQIMTYCLTHAITKNSVHYDLTIYGFDDKLPFLSIFIVPYILAYPFWYITPLLIAKLKKHEYINWSLSVIITYIVFFIIYICLPTTITRPVVENNNIFDYLVNFIYMVDNPELPSNLFPSIHCGLSILCYLGVMGRKEFPKWYRVFALIFAFIICLSTQFVKQHYIVDFISAFVITVGAHIAVTKFKLYRLFIREDALENGN